MARERQHAGAPPETVISIIGPGMKVVGDLETDGTIRVEGRVEGTIRAGKAVVVGREGLVDGEIVTQDAVISGRVRGSLRADSRLEVQATSVIEGDVVARRIQLEEGAVLNGTVQMTEGAARPGGGAAPGGTPDRGGTLGGGAEPSPAADAAESS